MKIFNHSAFFGIVFLLVFFCVVCSIEAYAQSTNIEFPTPVTTAEIEGKIAARDIGDSRLTTYYYTFNGRQGDIFLKINTANLNGDIEIFYADSLRSLAKITVYADAPQSETGREIYIRKPEKLLLRVEGRTPNDDPAAFSVKFAGSFIAASSIDESPEVPTVKGENETNIRVNSVGTILEIKERPAKKTALDVAKTKKTEERLSENDITEESEKQAFKPEVAVAENITETKTAAAPVRRRGSAARRTAARKTPPLETASKPKTSAASEAAKAKAAKDAELKTALENIRLMILLKDGSKIERPMSEVLRVGVDKGILTVVAKDGSIGRYSLLDIAKFTVE